MLDFSHEVSRVQQSQSNMILIKPFQVKFLEPPLVSFAHSFEPVDHFLMMTPTLHFVPSVDKLTHLNVKALSLALVGEQLVCFTDQEEVVVELLFRAPVSDSFLTCFPIHVSSINNNY